MTYDHLKHRRRSIRLKGYDYAQNGAYAVTIVAQDRACLFGEVANNVMQPNAAGQMVQTVWEELSIFYPGVLVDEFIVMPNHIHGIIILDGAIAPSGIPPASVPPVGAAPRGRPGPLPDDHDNADRSGQTREVAPDQIVRVGAETQTNEEGQAQEPGQAREPGQAQGPAPTGIGLTLGDVVQRFKTLTTKRYADGVKCLGWDPFPGRLWQRNYYEHIIRGEAAMDRMRGYVIQNPLRWESDDENPRMVTR